MAAPSKPDDWRKFEPPPMPTKANRSGKPLIVGLLGPPGSGKTRSMLRMMRGVQRVFPGPLVLVDTEAGRSKLYSPREGETAQPDHPTEPTYDFERIILDPPFRGDRCWAAIKNGLKVKPAALGFDNISDEHQGEGGYLRWHDAEVERMGGNEWGAWNRPSAARHVLISGISHVAPPPILFLTFVSEEKTLQTEEDDPKNPGRKKKVIKNKGWTPVAPLMILKTLDLTCILPWDSKGVPIWEARNLPYEDFIRKWPEQLRGAMTAGQITEAHGEALARWVKGEVPTPQPTPGQAPQQAPGGGPIFAKSRPPGPPETDIEAGRLILEIGATLRAHGRATPRAGKTDLDIAFNGLPWADIQKLPADQLAAGLKALRSTLEGVAELASQGRERQPGEDDGD